jgi:hypothetical protein
MVDADTDTLDWLIRDIAQKQAGTAESLPKAEQRIRNILRGARARYRMAGAAYGDTDAGFIWWIAREEAIPQ